MAKLNVNIGLSVNDKTGDTLRTAFDKINQNFTELYTLTGGTSTALTELAQDYAAPMFNHASHVNITATYDDANNKILLTGVAAQVQSDWNASSGLGVILNKPTLFSGSYTDLTDKPTIPSAYTLPTASSSVLGGIKIGTGLSIDVNGVVTASSGSVSSLVNGANSVSLDNGGLDLTFTSGEKIKTVFGGGIELYRSGDNTIGSYVSGAKINTFASGGAKHTWTFGTGGTTTFPNNSIKNSPDSNTAITTEQTLTANNSYTNVTDFSTDVDLGSGIGVIAGWYQRNASQIEFALFGDSTFQSYLTGLALGRTVIVTYNTASGTATLTRTVTQVFASTGQSDPNNPSRGRVSGRIDAILPAGQLGIVSINFPVYSTDTNNWTFGADGTLTLPGELDLGGQTYTNNAIIWQNGNGAVINYNNIDNYFVIAANDSGPTQYWKFHDNGRTTFPNGTVPEHSYGAAGDKEGMVVFTDPYIYYCKQDYVNNTTDIWVRVAWTGTNW